MADVYHNHGRWVVDCNDEWCANAEEVVPSQGVVACTNCRRFIDIAWPPNPNLIASILEVRPVPQTRNWYPGETVKDLERENVDYGVDST